MIDEKRHLRSGAGRTGPSLGGHPGSGNGDTKRSPPLGRITARRLYNDADIFRASLCPVWHNCAMDVQSTADLLFRIREGDENAKDQLLRTYLPLLKRWAAGRLPDSARGLSDTDDLVQVTLVRVLAQVDRFDSRFPGAFFAYLRRSLLNNLRNEIRRASRSSGMPEPGELIDDRTSPLDRALGQQTVDAYEESLETLEDEEKAAVILRLEFGCRHREVAELLGKPSADAARMTISRALLKLAQNMEDVDRE